jgi:hypothetical protein
MKMKQRGSALVSVILVLLVLTIVGVGIAYFTSMEDRLSGNTRIAKAGFYAADAGLRRGEALLNEVVNLPVPCVPPNLSQILAARSAAVLKVPGGGYDAHGLDLSTLPVVTVACLGADARAYLDVPIPPPAGVSVVDRVTYSLYLRNNVDDLNGSSDIVDLDKIVNLVSVGTANLATGALVTKIIEEQLLLSRCGGSTGGQKDVNKGGTNAISGSDC